QNWTCPSGKLLGLCVCVSGCGGRSPPGGSRPAAPGPRGRAQSRGTGGVSSSCPPRVCDHCSSAWCHVSSACRHFSSASCHCSSASCHCSSASCHAASARCHSALALHTA